VAIDVLNVHPSDRLAAAVEWENAENQEVPEPTGDTTQWQAVNTSDGGNFAAAVFAAGADDEHQTITFGDPQASGTFTLQATLTGANLVATSTKQITVSPDNTPTQGVITVDMAPAPPTP